MEQTLNLPFAFQGKETRQPKKGQTHSSIWCYPFVHFHLFYAHYCLFILTSHPCAYLCSYESISTFSSQQSFGMTLSSAICFVSSTDHRPFITVTLRMFYSALTESWECANSHIVFVYVCLYSFVGVCEIRVCVNSRTFLDFIFLLNSEICSTLNSVLYDVHVYCAAAASASAMLV